MHCTCDGGHGSQNKKACHPLCSLEWGGVYSIYSEINISPMFYIHTVMKRMYLSSLIVIVTNKTRGDMKEHR